jgi:hypothetical protein
MRLFIVGVALLSSLSTTAAAQSRWTFSAGPEWYRNPQARLWGMRLRAEYDLTKPGSVFGMRLEGGARWGPTQSYFYQIGGRSQGGTEQRMDLIFGLSGALSPFPRARVSPYVTMGIYGRQMWGQWSSYFQDSTFGSRSIPYHSFSGGDIIATLGLGLRARVGGHSFQLELRRIHDHNGLTFGTRLPF